MLAGSLEFAVEPGTHKGCHYISVLLYRMYTWLLLWPGTHKECHYISVSQPIWTDY